MQVSESEDRWELELVVYFGLLAALFVRVGRADGNDGRPPAVLEAPAAELRLVRLHHRLFYFLLAASLAEYLLTGRPSLASELTGVMLFAGGLLLYRVAGKALGSALSPLVSPASSDYCRTGIYGVVRHPMYLGELLMACGAPLVLGSSLSLVLVLPVALVLAIRVSREEQMWVEQCPDYSEYCDRVSRFIPFLF